MKTRSKYDYECIEPKYFCIFLQNVFDFCLGSQFCCSIDEALQENRTERKEKWNLNVFMILLNPSILVFVILYLKVFVFCILNNIFLMNVFGFQFGSYFYCSIDEAKQENRKEIKEKENLNIASKYDSIEPN